LSGSSVTVSAQTQKNTTNTCGCYWKKYVYTASQPWQHFDTLVISAGKDFLNVLNNSGPPVITKNAILPETFGSFSCRSAGSKLFIKVSGAALKALSVFDCRGREIAAAQPQPSSLNILELPSGFSSNVVYVRCILSSGRIVEQMVQIVR
ncbi:MAG TPA: hypothetical protein VF335_08490, partial [Chitinivibrionales bacterium]